MRLLAFISPSFQKADRLVRGFNAMIYVLSCLVRGSIYLALNSSQAFMVREETFEHTTFGVSFFFFLNKLNNICFSPLLWSGKAKNFILRKKGGNRKSHHTKHFHYQTLGDVMGNQKGPTPILQFCKTKH